MKGDNVSNWIGQKCFKANGLFFFYLEKTFTIEIIGSTSSFKNMPFILVCMKRKQVSSWLISHFRISGTSACVAGEFYSELYSRNANRVVRSISFSCFLHWEKWVGLVCIQNNLVGASEWRARPVRFEVRDTMQRGATIINRYSV